MTQIGQMAGSI